MNILTQLFFAFIQVGMFSVGGGYAAIPLIQNQIVDIHGLMTLAEFTDLITIAEMTPGPISINSATFVGMRLAGIPGVLLCTLGCIIPSFCICLALAHFYYKYRSFSGVQTVLSALASPTVRDRVKAVYNNDGPGFTKKVLTAPGYLELIPRIHSFVPQSSVVGMLLEHEDPYTVIKSRQLGIFQHDPYSWEVQGGGFVVVDQVTQGSRKLDQTVKSWLDALTPTDREVFLDGLYQALAGTQARSLDDLAQPKNLYTVFQGLTRLDEGTRTSIARTLGLLAKSAAGVLLDDDS